MDATEQEISVLARERRRYQQVDPGNARAIKALGDRMQQLKGNAAPAEPGDPVHQAVALDMAGDDEHRITPTDRLRMVQVIQGKVPGVGNGK